MIYYCVYDVMCERRHVHAVTCVCRSDISFLELFFLITVESGGLSHAWAQ